MDDREKELASLLKKLNEALIDSESMGRRGMESLQDAVEKILVFFGSPITQEE